MPHAALRLHAMGERGSDHTERPTADEIAAHGPSSPRRASRPAASASPRRARRTTAPVKGEYTPSLTAEHAELVGIASALGRISTGVLQVVSDFVDIDEEAIVLHDMAATGRPLSISLAAGSRRRPTTTSGCWPPSTP